MKVVFNQDASYRRMKVENIVKRFCAKYNKPEWEETFFWMVENKIDFFSDNRLADGTRNVNWCFALHLDIDEDCTYIALIERA